MADLVGPDKSTIIKVDPMEDNTDVNDTEKQGDIGDQSPNTEEPEVTKGSDNGSEKEEEEEDEVKLPNSRVILLFIFLGKRL